MIFLYSMVMVTVGTSIAESKKNNDNRMVKFTYKASMTIIFVICSIVWFILS